APLPFGSLHGTTADGLLSRGHDAASRRWRLCYSGCGGTPLPAHEKERTVVTVIAKLKVKAGSDASFRQAADTMIAHVTANEAGTVTYILYRSTADPNEFAFYELYQDQAALAVHGSSEAMQQFFAAVAGLLDGRPEITLYE